MNPLKQARITFLVLLLVLLGANLWLDETGEWLLTAGIIITVIVTIVIHMKIEQHQRAQAMHELKTQFLHTLNIQRHDWMNDLQVIYGYIQLKKLDNLKASVEKINSKLLQDSHIAKLGNPEISLFLYAYRNQCQTYLLTVEVVNGWEVPQRIEMSKIRQIVESVLNQFDQAAQSEMNIENKLTLYFMKEDEGISLEFVYEGAYDALLLKEELNAVKHLYSSLITDMELEANDTNDQVQIIISVS
jgi:stage 0 sporulation protein B (sporulation initiation phosphotransferase)